MKNCFRIFFSTGIVFFPAGQPRFDSSSYIKKELDDLKENVSEFNHKQIGNKPGELPLREQNQVWQEDSSSTPKFLKMLVTNSIICS